MANSERRRNYEICTSLDMTKLHVTLDKMLEDGTIDTHERALYFGIAHNLLELLRLANRRPRREEHGK